jgi:putative ABC transport system permease protein
MAKSSVTTAASPLKIPPDKISSILVKVAKGADAHAVALDIQKNVPGVVAVESPNLFGAFRKQLLGLLSGFVLLSVIAWALSGVLIGLIFSMSIHERRREVAVLRALGFTKFYVFRAMWVEAALLASAGTIVGMGLSALSIYYFRNYIAGTLAMPFLFPQVTSFMGTFGIGFLISLITVSAAVFLPAYRISQQEPALAMRE